MTNVSERGLFWLPDCPDRQVEGMFNVDESGVRLVLNDRILEDDPTDDTRRTIHGALVADHIKIVGAVRTQLQLSGGSHLPVHRQETWFGLYAFRGPGPLFDDDFPANISLVECQIESLEEWVQGFEGIRSDIHGASGSLSWVANPPDISHGWNLGDVAIRQTIHWSAKAARNHQREFTVKTNTFFRVNFNEPQCWSTAQDVVLSLQALVSIAFGRVVNVEWTAVVDRLTGARWVAYYHQIPKASGRPDRHNELFTMAELGGIEGIAKWLNVLHNKEIVKTRLFVDRYRETPLLTDRTGHLLIACEVYRRPTMDQSTKRVKVDTDILVPMLCKAGQRFRAWIGKPSAWAKKVSDMRSNWGIAHFQRFQDRSVDGACIHTINQQLYALLVLCILDDCGISEHIKDEVIDRFRAKRGRLLI